jgi:diacylglycerol kinase (ATP)
MSRVAVVAHAGKTLDGGLPELRRVLESEGVVDPLWYEVAKSSAAPKQVRRALRKGAELIIAWGGDGMMQRCIDTIADSDTTLAIVPAGTANLLAHNLGIPEDVSRAVAIGIHGGRRRIDVGRLNGECFAVMAGAGFVAKMIGDADGGLKDTLGRLAYVWTGAKNLRARPVAARIEVDGSTWYKGDVSCILLGNVGKLFGGIEAFGVADPDDGWLELGIVTADGVVDWTRTIVRTGAGAPEKSPFVRTIKARSLTVSLGRKMLYELDGGPRAKTKKLKVKVKRRAVSVAVPAIGEGALP